MSLIPMLFSDWWEDLERPHSLMDQDFGVALRPEQLIAANYLLPAIYGRANSPARSNSRLTPSSYYRPWGELLRSGDGGSSVVKADKDQFKVILDVQQFKPEEINVKVVDKCVIVEAKHEEKRDEHGWISRQFERRYLIPDQCNIDEVSSSLSSDGVLTITAPRKEQPKIEGGRQIKIQHTGQPAVKEAPSKESQGPKEEKKKQQQNAVEK